MSRLQFSFHCQNLKATADYLATSPHFPTEKHSVEQIQDRLKNAAINSFSSKYSKVQMARGRPLERGDVEEDVVEAPVLWRGIGALFSPVTSAGVDGEVTLTIEMPFELEPKCIVGVYFLVVLR